MSEGKYYKYVNKLGTKGIRNPAYGSLIREPLFFDKTVYENAPIDLRFLLISGSGCGFGIGAQVEGDAGGLQMPRDIPHFHDCDEVFLFVGTDPQDYRDLGGEVEFWIGKGEEAEKYVFTEPTSIFIPKGLVHLPVYFRNVRKPFFMVPILVNVKEWTANLVDIFPSGFKERLDRK
ncbi:MAG: hypothetical protein GX938_09840 [Spirochaetales bacterium]|nr:hypothetical protein [Spirochaetales bacterium]